MAIMNVEIKHDVAFAAFDVEVHVGKDDVRWFAPGAIALEVKFKNSASAVVERDAGKKANVANDLKVDGRQDLGGVWCEWPRAKHAQWTMVRSPIELEYEIHVRYPSSSGMPAIDIDPKVIIQP